MLRWEENSLNFLNDATTYEEHLRPEESDETKRKLQIEKIKGLANLIEANNEINEHQIQLIGTIILNSDLTEEEKSKTWYSRNELIQIKSQNNNGGGWNFKRTKQLIQNLRTSKSSSNIVDNNSNPSTTTQQDTTTTEMDDDSIVVV